MKCELHVLRLVAGCARMLVELDSGISLQTFLDNLRAWTEKWFAEYSSIGIPTGSYWEPDFLVAALSPEDKTSTCADIDTSEVGFETRRVSNGDKFTTLHHVIAVTTRRSMTIPLKYAYELCGHAVDACASIGIIWCRAEASRNHIHILCEVPQYMSAERLAYSLKAKLAELVFDNPHFRNFKGWTDDTIVYTVAPHRLLDEEHVLCLQSDIHAPWRIVNEMCPLYQRLQIPYVFSLR